MLKSCLPGGGYVDTMGRNRESLAHLLRNQPGIIID
jgi:hypothetical protein